MNKKVWSIRIAGVALRGSGYPNAEQTIKLLRRSDEWRIHDHARWLPPETRLWHLVTGQWKVRIALIGCLVVSGLTQAVSVVFRTRRNEIVYLPYPAPVTLWWLSFIPRRWRPRCVADAFISLWDSTFKDRSNGRGAGVLANLALRYERRGLRAAAMVLVDTELNKREFVRNFGLDDQRVRSLPLSIDEAMFQPRCDPDSAVGAPVRILFVGTLVPLHGIAVLLRAIELLANRPDLEFKLVGDGQDRAIVEEFVGRAMPRNFTWVREWQSLDAIATEIRNADICLGVFGGAGKAARVLPFKLYYALAAGKPIVTQAAYSLPDGVPALPVVLVRGGPHAELAANLADSLSLLASDPVRRTALSSCGAEYFREHLSGSVVLEQWRRLSEVE